VVADHSHELPLEMMLITGCYICFCQCETSSISRKVMPTKLKQPSVPGREDFGRSPPTFSPPIDADIVRRLMKRLAYDCRVLVNLTNSGVHGTVRDASEESRHAGTTKTPTLKASATHNLLAQHPLSLQIPYYYKTFLRASFLLCLKV
jgi:hypothetical protein